MWGGRGFAITINSTDSIKCLWPQVTFKLLFTTPLCQMPLSPFLIPCIYVTAVVKQKCSKRCWPWPSTVLKVHTNVKPMTSFLLRVTACLNRSSCLDEARWIHLKGKRGVVFWSKYSYFSMHNDFLIVQQTRSIRGATVNSHLSHVCFPQRNTNMRAKQKRNFPFCTAFIEKDDKIRLLIQHKSKC